ncbi:MAG: PDZ domain-containing protein [Ruminiclostridium sp.]|nr:PDZ domain-containing protein [Ruminiclostridium sp.]
MKKRYSIGVVISVCAIACAITFVITVTVATNMFNKLIGGVTQREEIYSKIQEIDSYVRNAAYYDIDEQSLINGIVNGYVGGLTDPEAAYLTEAQANKKRQTEAGTMVSAGLELGREESGYLRVDSIYANSPAEGLDIKGGDIITAVDGNNVLEIGAEAAITAVDGDENTNVRLSVQRSGETKTVTITRKTFTVQSVTSAVVSGYGYIRIDAFNQQTDKQFISELQQLQANGVLGYVIDLRNCRGIYDGLSNMLVKFAPGYLMANARHKDGTITKFLETAASEDKITEPTVVLVNEGTAGAAELFSLCMKDHASAKIVGRQTAGKGTVAETKNLSDGTAIVITTAEILSVSSTSISGGIKADFSVELIGDPVYQPDSLITDDPQLNKAFEVVEGM